jgi:hypothetical protein
MLPPALMIIECFNRIVTGQESVGDPLLNRKEHSCVVANVRDFQSPQQIVIRPAGSDGGLQ